MDRPSRRQRLALDLDVLRAGDVQHLLDAVAHVLRHLQLVVAESIVEAQDRNAPRVLDVRIQQHAILFARQHFAESAEADVRGIVFAHVRLEALAVAGEVVRHARILGAAAAALEVVAADEIGMLVGDVAEPRDVRRHRTPVIERRLSADARRDEAAALDAHDVLAQVAAKQPRRVADAVRIRSRLRVEEDARRVERARAEHDHRRAEIEHLFRVRIDHADTGGLVRRRVDDDLGDDRVRTNRQVAGVARRVDERGRRVERRLEVAAAAAASAPGAARAVLVEHAFGRHAGAARDVVAPHLRDRSLERDLDAIELRRPLEDAVGNLIEILFRAGAAEQHVHLVVVRLHIVVADRPVDVEPVAPRGIELQRPVAQRAAAPEVRLAAENVRAHPRVRRAGGRVLPLVHHPVAGEPVGRV